MCTSKLRKQGIRPGTIVALISGRSVGTIVSILGILKAGAAYLPIDPEYPEARKTFMMEDSAAGILIDQQCATGSKGEYKSMTEPYDAPGAKDNRNHTFRTNGRGESCVRPTPGIRFNDP